MVVHSPIPTAPRALGPCCVRDLSPAFIALTYVLISSGLFTPLFCVPWDKLRIWHGSLCTVLGNCWLRTGTFLAIAEDFPIVGCIPIASPFPVLSHKLASRIRINMHSSSGWIRKEWAHNTQGSALEHSRTLISSSERVAFFLQPDKGLVLESPCSYL